MFSDMQSGKSAGNECYQTHNGTNPRAACGPEVQLLFVIYASFFNSNEGCHGANRTVKKMMLGVCCLHQRFEIVYITLCNCLHDKIVHVKLVACYTKLCSRRPYGTFLICF